jgi:hypothetical protein
MERCCTNPYSDCGSLPSCFDNLAIRIPSSYIAPTIGLKFTKKGMTNITAKTTLEVVDGWVLLDLEALPDKYLNAFSGVYEMEFLLLNGDGFNLPFIAKDGQSYERASFQIEFSTSATDTVQLNVIDNAIYP